MKKLLHIGAGPIHLDSDEFLDCENSDGAGIVKTESSKSWNLEKIRDFTKPFDDIVDNSVDYIVFWHCLEHLGLSEKDDVLREFLRMLKPNGELFLALPNITEIAKHIVDRDGPWSDWFICMVNLYGPYNGYVGDFHKWGWDYQELEKILASLGFRDYQQLTPQYLVDKIGSHNAQKLGFAEYNIQVLVRK